MSSSLIVPVAKIKKVGVHPNASLLSVVEVLGYQVVVGLIEDPNGSIVRKFLKDQIDKKGKRIPLVADYEFNYFVENKDGSRVSVNPDEVETVKFSFQYNEGDLVVYFPGDTVLTDEWADAFNIKSLLKTGNRVGKVLLRGEPSFGLVVKVPEGVQWSEGDNVAEFYGATKYEPPFRASDGDAAAYDSEIDPYFDKFTDIQNGRLFTDVFIPGEQVVMSEKLHGCNDRVGIINGHKVAGSMELRRKPPEDGDFSKSRYWFPWSIPGVSKLLEDLSVNNKIVELFGEVYGNSIQKGFKYDAGNTIGFRSFGIKIGSHFLNWDDFEIKCVEYGIPVVPVLYVGKFDMSLILSIIEKTTTLGNAPVMEGGVVVSAPESIHPKIGRKALKYISNQYDLLKNKPDCKDV
jgi:RNA ligase (TIGR02306 family)